MKHLSSSLSALLLCLVAQVITPTTHAFAVHQVAGAGSSGNNPPPHGKVRGGGGGRAPSEPDQISSPLDEGEKWEATPNADGECRLIICQITDVYTLGKCVVDTYTHKTCQVILSHLFLSLTRPFNSLAVP